MQLTLDVILDAALAWGFRVEQIMEDGKIVVKVYRQDGSLAMTVTREKEQTSQTH